MFQALAPAPNPQTTPQTPPQTGQLTPGQPVPLSGPPRRLVVFLGGQLSFPPPLLRLIESEIEELELIRLDPQKLSGPEMIPPDCHLVFEDSLAARLLATPALPQLAMLIHAYRQTPLARELLLQSLQRDAARGDRHHAPLRFLPLHMPLSSFVALMRILLAGDSVVPCELLEPVAGATAPPLAPSDPSDTARPAMPLPRLPEPSLPLPPLSPPLSPPRSAPRDPRLHLTPREAEVLALVACGQRNKLIAHRLQLSEHTVKLHIHHIISKIGATNRTEAAQWYQNQRAQDQRHHDHWPAPQDGSRPPDIGPARKDMPTDAPTDARLDHHGDRAPDRQAGQKTGASQPPDAALERGSDRMSERMPERMADRMPERGSDRAPDRRADRGADRRLDRGRI